MERQPHEGQERARRSLTLSSLPAGRRARVTGLRLGLDRRRRPWSPLRPGALVEVLEVKPGWLHVRIGFREYPLPLQAAEGVLVTLELEERGQERQPPGSGAAADEYAVLFSRLERGRWGVRVIERSSGTIVVQRRFDDEREARRCWEALRADATRLDPGAFRARHLP
jgi:hypothetical protein